MGISGLTTFMENNPHLLEDHHLHDCLVVVDGNNLCYALFHRSRADSCFGGDYSAFRDRVRKYFDVLKACSVRALVVFDGGYDPQSGKIKVSEQRSKQRLSITIGMAARVREGRSRLAPILSMIHFQEILRDMGVSMVQSNFEADAYIVAVANHLKCPVISQDSDFYIYQLKGGFIPNDSISETFDYKGDLPVRFLSSRIYFVRNFLECFFDLDEGILPLFGCLVGNDFIAGPAAFKNLYRNIKLPKLKLRKKLKMSPQQTKILGLLAWLECRTTKEAIDKVVTFLKKPERADTKALLKRTVANYRRPQDLTLLRFLGLPDPSTTEDQRPPQLLIAHGCPGGVPFPDWFHDDFYSCLISPFVLNAAWAQEVILLSQVENFAKESSYVCSERIRQILYGILNATREASPEGDKISEFVVRESRRRFKSQFKSPVAPFSSLPGFGKLPNLNAKNGLSVERAKALIREALRVEEWFEEVWPEDWILFWSSVSYWIKTTKPDNVVVIAFIIVMIFCYFIGNQSMPAKKSGPKLRRAKWPTIPVEETNGKVGTEVTDTIEELIRSVSRHEMTELRQKMLRYCVRPVFHPGDRLDIAIIHSLAELQTCYLSAYYLHQLLRRPWGTPAQVHRLFYGTFDYNLCAALKNEPNPVNFVANVLSRSSTFYKIFYLVYKALPGMQGKKALPLPLESA